MICYKHALGKNVAFRVRKFGFCFLGGCLFVCLVFVFTKQSSIANDLLPLAEQSRGEEWVSLGNFLSLMTVNKHRLSSKTQWVPMSLLLQITHWKTSKHPFPQLKS